MVSLNSVLNDFVARLFRLQQSIKLRYPRNSVCAVDVLSLLPLRFKAWALADANSGWVPVCTLTKPLLAYVFKAVVNGNDTLDQFGYSEESLATTVLELSPVVTPAGSIFWLPAQPLMLNVGAQICVHVAVHGTGTAKSVWVLGKELG